MIKKLTVFKKFEYFLMNLSAFENKENQDPEIPFRIQNMCKSLAFIDYSSLIENEETKKVLTRESYELLGKFNGNNIFDSIADVVAEIDKSEIIELIKNPPKIVLSFTQFFHTYVSKQSILFSSFSWPPCFSFENSLYSEKAKLLYYILIKMVYDSKSPNKMLVWIMTSLLENDQKYQSEKVILAASIIQTKPRVKFAVLDEDKHLHIYEPNENGEGLKSLFDKKVARFKVNDDEFAERMDLIAYDTIGREAIRFPLADSLLLPKWERVFSKNPPFLYEFLTKIEKPVPSLVYQGINKSIMRFDMIYVHAMCSPDVVNPAHYDDLAISLLDVADYGQKFLILFQTVLGSIFENPCATVEFICSDKCILKYFAPAVVLRMDETYTKTFGKKLTDYIGSGKHLDVMEDSERVGVVFFTCMKYILDSLEFIPTKFKSICALIAQYVAVKFNSVDAVVRVISSFFGYFMFRYLNDIAAKTGNSSFIEISKLIKTAFGFTKLLPKYNVGDWQKRIEKKFYPKIFSFALSLCDQIGEIALDVPPVGRLVCAIEKIMAIIVSDNKKLVAKTKELLLMNEGKAFRGKTSATSWSFVVGISLWFARANENCADGEKLHAPAFPALLAISPFTQKNEIGKSLASLAAMSESMKESEFEKCKFGEDEEFGDIESLKLPRKIKIIQEIEIPKEPISSEKSDSQEDSYEERKIVEDGKEQDFSDSDSYGGSDAPKGENDSQFSELSVSSQY